MWFQNRRAKWRKKENTKKGPGRPAHNALPLTCSGDPIPADELKRKEEQRLAKKRSREVERLERAAARKTATKPSRNNTVPPCATDETADIDVVGMDQPRVPPADTFTESDLSVERAKSGDLDMSFERASERSDVVKVEKDVSLTRYDNVSHDRRFDVAPDETGAESWPSRPELVTRTVAKSPETRRLSFSIESLLERRRTRPPGERRPNYTHQSSRRPYRRPAHLQFQQVGFQVERLPPSAVCKPESMIYHSLPAV